MSDILQGLSDEPFCYLTTTGRVTGRPHTIEIWFALHDATLYMLAGGRERTDWVKNARHTPEVTIRIGTTFFMGWAREVRDAREDTLARRLVYSKYAPQEEGLEEWARTSLPMAFELTP